MLATLTTLDTMSKPRIYQERGQWWADINAATFGPFHHQAEAQDEIQYLTRELRAPAVLNQVPSFEEEIDAPTRAAEIFANTRQIYWSGAVVLARAWEQSLDDPKSLAVVQYLIRHFHRVRKAKNGILMPSDSSNRYYLVSASSCSCPARVARCKHQRAATLWLRCQVD